MLTVYICVGSSCHIKGSYDIIKAFEECVKKYSLEDKVELKASFCLGHCTKGVSVKVDDDFIEELSAENAEQKFIDNILVRFSNIDLK